MKPLIGTYDPGNGAPPAVALSRVAGADPREAIRIGALTVVGATSVGRCGATTCLFRGDLHDAFEVSEALGLAPSATAGLIVATGCERGRLTFLRDLRGAYQLVLWDAAREDVLVAQDHLSARAIFYGAEGRRFAFASEIAPLLRALPQRPAPDQRAVAHWTAERTLPDGLTLYDGVHRLPMGWAIRASVAGHRRERVWEPRCEPLKQVGPSEATAAVRSAVGRAVRRSLDPGASTGILLSGGFDSGTLAATTAPILRERGHRLAAYSSVFPGEPWDESGGVETLAGHFEMPSTRVRVRGGAVATAANYQAHWEMPQPAPGAILDQPLFALARQDGRRVVLDGQGGDELFAASPFLLTDHVLRLRWRAAWRLAHRLPELGGTVSRSQARRLFTEVVLKGALPYSAHMVAARRRASPSQLDWLRHSPDTDPEMREVRWRWKRNGTGRPRWWSFLSYLLVEARELVGMQDFLRRRGEMFGIESRQPLLTDVDLVESMLRMPPELAFSPDYDRALARDAMRGLVPEPVRIPQHKSDYSALMHQTLARDDLSSIVRLLSQPDAEIAAYVDLDLARRRLLERPPRLYERGWQVWGHHVWGLVVIELWLRGNALGSDFVRWTEKLQFPPCRVEVLRAPEGTLRQEFSQPMFALSQAPGSGSAFASTAPNT